MRAVHKEGGRRVLGGDLVGRVDVEVGGVRRLESPCHKALTARHLFHPASDVGDDEAALLAPEIAREIEDRLEYPGQVKVTVIRESRAVEVAKNHSPTTAQQPDSGRSDQPADTPIQAA